MHVDMSSLHESDTGLPVSPSSNSKLNDEISVYILISSNCVSNGLIPYRYFN